MDNVADDESSAVSVSEVPRTAVAAPPTFTFEEERMATFLASMRNAVLATINPDGSPQATPTWYHWDGQVLRISSPEWTRKVRNIRRDPRVSVCIDDQVSGTYVTMFGTAELVEGNGVQDATWPVLLKYLHEDEAGVRWTRLSGNHDRVVIAVRPQRMVWRNSVR